MRLFQIITNKKINFNKFSTVVKQANTQVVRTRHTKRVQFTLRGLPRRSPPKTKILWPVRDWNPRPLGLESQGLPNGVESLCGSKHIPAEAFDHGSGHCIASQTHNTNPSLLSQGRTNGEENGLLCLGRIVESGGTNEQRNEWIIHQSTLRDTHVWVYIAILHYRLSVVPTLTHFRMVCSHRKRLVRESHGTSSDSSHSHNRIQRKRPGILKWQAKSQFSFIYFEPAAKLDRLICFCRHALLQKGAWFFLRHLP